MGDPVGIEVGGSSLQATTNQAVVVVMGTELKPRRRPRHLKPGERTASAFGRWVEARDLRVGDDIRTRTGEEAFVTPLSLENTSIRVHWLEVEELASFAVHRMKLLAHNKRSQDSGDEMRALTVYGTATLENYAVSVLGARSASALAQWLVKNGYPVSYDVRRSVSEYVDEGWAFVAVKLNPSKQRRYDNELLPPLTVCYYSNDQVLSRLRISRLSTVEAVGITLSVFAQSTVSSRNFPTRTLVADGRGFRVFPLETYVTMCIVESIGADGRGLAIFWKGETAELRNTYEWDGDKLGSILRKLAGSAERRLPHHLTRLEARLNPSAKHEDIQLVLDPKPQDFGPVDLNPR